jgi:hypothetical protein
VIAGGLFDTTSILDLKTEDIREYMRVNFEPNLCKQTSCLLRFLILIDYSCLPGYHSLPSRAEGPYQYLDSLHWRFWRQWQSGGGELNARRALLYGQRSPSR